MLEVPQETAIVIHDAGAANLVLAWTDDGSMPASRVYAEGPAARLWAERDRPPPAATLEEALDGATTLISGTGWQSDLEHRARQRAKAAGLRSIAVLDHWVNYRERFVRDGLLQMPDELIVADADAQRIAHETFPEIPVHRLPNRYLDGVISEVHRLEKLAAERPFGLLLVMEPARADWGRVGDGCFQALDYLASNWDALGLPAGIPVRLRPHPSDPAGRYEAWMAAHADRDPVLSESASLAEDIAYASHVAGMNSFALTIALAAGRETISILPPWAPASILPHAGIRHLRNMQKVARS